MTLVIIDISWFFEKYWGEILNYSRNWHWDMEMKTHIGTKLFKTRKHFTEEDRLTLGPIDHHQDKLYKLHAASRRGTGSGLTPEVCITTFIMKWRELVRAPLERPSAGNWESIPPSPLSPTPSPTLLSEDLYRRRPRTLNTRSSVSGSKAASEREEGSDKLTRGLR